MTAGYDLNSFNHEKIVNNIKEWLKDDQYIFPLHNGVSDFLIYLYAI